MNELITKQFQNDEIRMHVDEASEPWFVAKDVCDALGLRVALATKRLDQDEVSSRDLVDSAGKRQAYTVVNESGLYSLIMGSRKEEAKKFKKWVTSDVLPSVRKTGSYSSGMTHAEQLLAYAQQMVNQEKIAARTSAELKKTVVRVDVVEEKVETHAKQLESMQRIRKGDNPVPYGCITLPKIRTKYFHGLSEANISKFLAFIGHPFTPTQYQDSEGVNYQSKNYHENGLATAFDRLIDGFEFDKETPQRLYFEHPDLGTYCFKIDELTEDDLNKLRSKMSVY